MYVCMYVYALVMHQNMSCKWGWKKHHLLESQVRMKCTDYRNHVGATVCAVKVAQQAQAVHIAKSDIDNDLIYRCRVSELNMAMEDCMTQSHWQFTADNIINAYQKEQILWRSDVIIRIAHDGSTTSHQTNRKPLRLSDEESVGSTTCHQISQGVFQRCSSIFD